MFESVQALLAEHGELQQELADPALHADAARAKKVNRRYAELSRIVAAHDAWQQAGDDLEAARELAKEDDAFAEEIPDLEEGLAQSQEKLRRLLIPRDPDDGRDVIMASAMPVLPLVPSTMVPPGWSAPAASAASTIPMPRRSFTLALGL